MAVAENAEQCRAITADGDRCSHAAQEDGFCHQHDESDRTVDEQSSGDGTQPTPGEETGDSDGEATAADDGAADDEDAEAENATDGTASDDPVDETADEPRTDDESGSDGGAGAEETLGDDGDEVGNILEVRETVHAVAERLIGQELDGVVEITRNGDDWLATVEVVERHAVPDTQDILGKYEVVLDTTGTVTGYRRLDTYRRGDTSRGDIAP